MMRYLIKFLFNQTCWEQRSTYTRPSVALYVYSLNVEEGEKTLRHEFHISRGRQEDPSHLNGLHVTSHGGGARAVLEVGLGVVLPGRSVGRGEVVHGVHLEVVGGGMRRIRGGAGGE